MSRTILFASLATVLPLAGCRGGSREPEPAPTVTIQPVAPTAVADEITVSGTIEAIDKAQVGFMVPGRIRSIDVADGATVAPGQLLATLDDSDYRQELAIAEAKYRETKARSERLHRLHELGSLTTADLDKITAALTEVESAVTLARQRVAYTRLEAPFGGRVARHPVSAGTVVAPGLPILTLLNPAPVWATLSVPEVDAAQVVPGQHARVRLAAVEGVEATAPVEAVQPQADPVTRSFGVKIRLENAGLEFRPGNVVTAVIALGPSRPALLVPPAAVQHYPDGALFVWMYDAARASVTRRIVTVGRAHASEVEITSGLAAGEQLVTGTTAPLFDGMGVAAKTP